MCSSEAGWIESYRETPANTVFSEACVVFPKTSEASEWREDWIIQGAPPLLPRSPSSPLQIRQEATAVSLVRGNKVWSQIMSPEGSVFEAYHGDRTDSAWLLIG